MALEVSYSRLIGYSDLFPGTAPTEKAFYAAGVGKDLIQKFCCHLLGHLRHEGFPDVDTFLVKAFTDYGYDYRKSRSYNALKDAYDKLQRNNRTTRFHILSIEALLSLFIWTETEGGLSAQGTENGMVAMLKLIQLILVFNDDVLKNYQTAYESSQHGPEELRFHRLSLATAFPQHDLVNSDYAQLIFTQSYKLAKLLTFLETDDFKPLLDALLQHYGCAAKEEYLKSIGGAIFTPLKGRNAGSDTLHVGDWPDGEGALFLSKLSVDTATLPTDQNDYKQLRETPLQNLQNGDFRVIYDLFLIKKAYNSLIFKLSELAKQIGMKKNFLGEIRKQFSEGVLLYEVLGECLAGHSDILMPGDQIDLKREPDTYARSKKRVMLFESKDFYLVAKEKLSYDFDTIVAGLQVDGRLLKAVKQTARNVARVGTMEFPFDQGYAPDDVTIYPVVVVHDALYAASSLNFWANEWFQQELDAAIKEHGFGPCDLKQVAPLTIIEIDSLILYKKHFANGTLDLPAIIGEYHNHVQFQNKGMNASLPFTEFFRDYCLQRDLVPDIPELVQMMKDLGVG